jgi:cellulose synthase/poly-beta-1,6-N-acetylglucosamine synthase-like glycosyltransferase
MAATVLLVAALVNSVLLALSMLPAAVWAVFALFLLMLTFAAYLARGRKQEPVPPGRRFVILVPAHNEELLIGEVVRGIFDQDYPRDLYTLYVIADNCSDTTAQRAEEAGATVLVRTSETHRGKGWALEWALDRIREAETPFDAVIIMDADSRLSSNFLASMNSALVRGWHAVQGFYGVMNVEESWRTRLMAVALALVHYTKPLGRRRLGLTVGLKGNGMCFSAHALKTVPWSGDSITEDIEYTLRLARAGIQVHFDPDAVVLAQMPVSGRQAASQRERWEGGRYGLLKRAVALLGEGVKRRDLRIADCGFELLIPPFVELMAVPILMLLLSAGWMLVTASEAARISLTVWTAILSLLFLYLILALAVAKVPLRTAAALLAAPLYAGWKFVLYAKMLLRGGPKGWVRTERRANDKPSGTT